MCGAHGLQGRTCSSSERLGGPVVGADPSLEMATQEHGVRVEHLGVRSGV